MQIVIATQQASVNIWVNQISLRIIRGKLRILIPDTSWAHFVGTSLLNINTCLVQNAYTNVSIADKMPTIENISCITDYSLLQNVKLDKGMIKETILTIHKQRAFSINKKTCRLTS